MNLLQNLCVQGTCRSHLRGSPGLKGRPHDSVVDLVDNARLGHMHLAIVWLGALTGSGAGPHAYRCCILERWQIVQLTSFHVLVCEAVKPAKS